MPVLFVSPRDFVLHFVRPPAFCHLQLASTANQPHPQPELNHFLLLLILWTHSWVCQTYICNNAISLHKVNMYFTSVSLLSGGWHGAEDEEGPSEQHISDQGGSQIRPVKAGLSPQKANPCEICGLILNDIFHLAEYQGTHHRQKLCIYAACEELFYFRANLYQHEKQILERNY